MLKQELVRFELSACAGLAIARWYAHTQRKDTPVPVFLSEQVKCWYEYARKASLQN